MVVKSILCLLLFGFSVLIFVELAIRSFVRLCILIVRFNRITSGFCGLRSIISCVKIVVCCYFCNVNVV